MAEEIKKPLPDIFLSFNELKADYYRVLFQIAFFEGITEKDRDRVCKKIQQLDRVKSLPPEPQVE